MKGETEANLSDEQHPMRPLRFPPLALAASLALLSLATTGAAQAQSRNTLLHDALHLDARQEEAWRAFQSAVAPDPQAQAQARQTAQLAPTLPTPRRLALIHAQMQSDLQGFDRTARAVQAFYDALTPDQQSTFDRQTAAQAGAPGAATRPPER